MKILMCAMALDIGGAETHVLELSRALCSMGHSVTVASNGGAYVRELEACGIKHVRIPLHTKAPSRVIKSYFALKKLIKKEKFDIVHAHARIPAFVCGLLHPVLHFRFVTTAHWVFDVNALWKRIAYWGEKTVAVSEGRGRGSISIHPAKAVRLIREAACRAMKKDAADCMFPLPDHFRVEISFKEHYRAKNAYPGVVQTGPAAVAYESDDWMEVLRMLDFVL